MQVVVIDLSLAADNALVIGAAAAGLPPRQRRRAVMIGLGAAVALRIPLAVFAVQLLEITGLLLAGGLLLLWVAWKMFRDLQHDHAHEELSPVPEAKTLRTAVGQILAADLAMSLDNILAVAGAAREHYLALAAGLILSVALMGAASLLTAKSIKRFPWLGWIGVAVVVYVAGRMVWDGVAQIGF
ncbi:MAG TPA: YjbE family putative metal transport protein [Alphaproteobacteria bacterium]|nr:YjbE family putative metal transport protein [Alphaproteobacteria bacterium]